MIIRSSNLSTNPYPFIKEQISEGLAYIESNLKEGISFDELNEITSNYVKPLYFPDNDISSRYSVSFNNEQEFKLDIEVEGEAYFVVKRPDESNVYARAKQFKIISGRLLVTSDNEYILQSTDLINPLENIIIPLDITEVMILKSGKLYTKPIVAPGTWDYLVQTAVARFANPAGLEDLGNGYYAETATSGPAIVGVPEGDENGFAEVTIKLNNPKSRNPVIDNILKSMGSNAVIQFNNSSSCNCYSESQHYYINMMINGLTEVPIESLSNLFAKINDQLDKSGLTETERTPLYMALSVAEATYEYWINSVKLDILREANSLSINNNWYNYGYFESLESTNRASIPYWVAAAIIGALAGSTYNTQLIEPLNPMTMQMTGMLMGGLTTGAGMVIFKYVPNF